MTDHHHHSPLGPLLVLGAAAIGGAFLYRKQAETAHGLTNHFHDDLQLAHERISALTQGAMAADAHIADVVNTQGAVLGQMRQDRYGQGPGPHD